MQQGGWNRLSVSCAHDREATSRRAQETDANTTAKNPTSKAFRLGPHYECQRKRESLSGGKVRRGEVPVCCVRMTPLALDCSSCFRHHCDENEVPMSLLWLFGF